MTIHREVFQSFEDQARRCRQLAGGRPDVSRGAASVLREIAQGLAENDPNPCLSCAVSLPYPHLNLSMPYPIDELRLVFQRIGKTRKAHIDLSRACELFGLTKRLLHTPTAKLSGGEQTLVSLCKVYVQAAMVDAICICSPFYWLDESRRRDVLRHFETLSVPVHLLVLEGEDDETAAVPAGTAPPEYLSWRLTINGPQVIYPALSFPHQCARLVIQYASSAHTYADLKSPTVVVGPNGVGKSTFARVLASLVQLEGGELWAETRGMTGSARLLFQDAPLQLFGQNPEDYLNRVFAYDQDSRSLAKEIYRSLVTSTLEELGRTGHGVVLANTGEQATLYQSKLALAAARLVDVAPLLILDEPAWCLSRASARSLVAAVTQKAHSLGCAVMLISHHPQWWYGLAGSELSLRSTSGDTVTVSWHDYGASRSSKEKVAHAG